MAGGPGRTRARRRRTPGSAWLIAPPFAYLVLLLVTPVVLIGLYSVFVLTNRTGVVTQFSWQNWLAFLPGGGELTTPFSTSSPFWNTFTISFAVTLGVSVATVVAAYPLALYLAFVARRRYLLLFVLLAPFFTSQLLRLLAWQSMLDSSGVVNSLLWQLGLRPDGQPVEWLSRTWFAVMLVLGTSWVSFTALPIFVVMDGIDRRVLEAAADLGAGRGTTFRRVVLPLSLPGAIAGFVFVLIPTTGEFVTPQLVGGSGTYMFGQAIQDLFVGSAIDWNQGAVLATWLMLVVVVLIALFARYLTLDLREARS
jgi:spermidine/putrescine transport system permease protein